MEKLTNSQINKMTNLLNGKLTKCQVDKMSKQENEEIIKVASSCQIGKMVNC